MSENREIIDALLSGDVWGGACALSGVSAGEIAAIALALEAETSDPRERLDLVAELAFPPPAPPGTDPRTRLLCVEAMGLLAVELAANLAEANWRELASAFAVLAGAQSPFRVQEATVGVLAKIASGVFEESRTFWLDTLLDADATFAGLAVRALASSEVPVARVLELLDTVVTDTRKALRESISSRALPELARRDPQAVYARLGRWSARGDEIACWNVAHALGTALGGRYVQEALEILSKLAADERPMVWRAAAHGLVQIAQRQPRLVLPELARWREDPARAACANLVLEILATR